MDSTLEANIVSFITFVAVSIYMTGSIVAIVVGALCMARDASGSFGGGLLLTVIGAICLSVPIGLIVLQIIGDLKKRPKKFCC